MYELIILGMLMKYNAHGFLLSKIINDIIGPVAKASNGRIYPLLSKLTTDGLIVIAEETVSEGGLPMRVYGITDKGRMRFHALMLDTDSSVRAYRELFGIKVSFFNFLSPEERIYLMNHYISYCEAHVQHVTAEMKDRRSRHGIGPNNSDYTLDCQEHVAQGWALELAWVIRLLNKELQWDPKTGPSDLPSALASLSAAIQCSDHIAKADKDVYRNSLAELHRLAGMSEQVSPILKGTLAELQEPLSPVPDVRDKFIAVWQLVQ